MREYFAERAVESKTGILYEEIYPSASLQVS